MPLVPGERQIDFERACTGVFVQPAADPATASAEYMLIGMAMSESPYILETLGADGNEGGTGEDADIIAEP